jgi:N-acyl-D-aspartate/D-glutamate deacylase
LARLTAGGAWHTGAEEASVSDWDLVLRGGRVIDPESGLDAVRDLAVANGRIAAIRSALRPAPVDVVVFDPETITDQASYRQATRASAGIRHVLVNGTFVVPDGTIACDARPGRPVRADPR